MKDCNYDPKMADFFNLTTYYGNEDDTFTEYMTPGLIITLVSLNNSVINHYYYGIFSELCFS